MKRTFDTALASMALVAMSPLLLAIAMLLVLTQGRPVFFIQERTGLDRRPFRLVKFRTMIDADNSLDGRLADGQRLTPLGGVLRRTSLDELPELWNVVKGDMSLVGPRPLPTRYLARYTAVEARRHEVRPGITGWAQIHGRNQVGWDERLALDVWYVDHRSASLDAKILLRTVGLVIRGRGIDSDDGVTMPELRPHLQ